MKRANPLAWHRAAIAGVILLLGVFALLFLRGPQSWQRLYYPLPEDMRGALKASGDRHQVSPYLLAAVAKEESDWDAGAQSGVGAEGLMQIMPSTAEELADRGLVDADEFPPARLSDPRVNIEYGAAYLRYLIERYHEIEVALAAYNAGLANADAWARQGGDIRDHIEFPETRRFVLEVSGGKDRYEALYPNAFDGWPK